MTQTLLINIKISNYVLFLYLLKYFLNLTLYYTPDASRLSQISSYLAALDTFYTYKEVYGFAETPQVTSKRALTTNTCRALPGRPPSGRCASATKGRYRFARACPVAMQADPS